MPLYDYVCEGCGASCTLLVKLDGPTPACPTCRASSLAKQVAPFAFTGFAAAPLVNRSPGVGGASAASRPKADHVHGTGCGCGPSAKPAAATSGEAPGCATAAYADQLIKKHLGP